jgi:hypothetical protein
MTNFVLMENPKCLEGGGRCTCSWDGSNACGEKMFGIHVTLVAQSMWKDSTVEAGY